MSSDNSPSDEARQDTDQPVSLEHVEWAYRVLLDREPENEGIVQAWFDRDLSSKELRSSLISSVEFRLKNPHFHRSRRTRTTERSIWTIAGSGYVIAKGALEWLSSRLRTEPDYAPAQLVAATTGRLARRPRVLLVSPYQVFPPNHGGGVRLFNLIKQLSATVDIYLIVFSTTGENEVQRRALSQYCAEVQFHNWEPEFHKDRFGVKPPSFQIFWSEEAANLIRDTVLEHDIDIVQLEYSELGQFARVVPVGVPVILTAHDITFRTHKRRLQLGFNHRYPESRSYCRSRMDLRRIFVNELAACRAVDQVHVMSREDGRYLARFLSDGWDRIRVVPNGVDCEGYAPRSTDPERKDVLFVGYFQNLPNQDALEFLAEEIWPIVRQRCPEATLTVVGSGADARTRRYTGKDGIRLVGEVPSVAPYYRSHRVMVAPIRAGSGTRLKILEAFAAGIPVVSTSLGAEGILAADEEQLILADEPGYFADQIVRLLSDNDVHQRISAAGQDLARSQYDWERIADTVRGTYEELLEGKFDAPGKKKISVGEPNPIERPGSEARDTPRGSSVPDKSGPATGFDPEARRPMVRQIVKPGPASVGACGSVLVLGVYLAHRPNNIQDIVSQIEKTRAFEVEQRWVALFGDPPSESVASVTVDVLDRRVPKMETINNQIAAVELQAYDYVVLCDDDVVLPQSFLDRFLAIQDHLEFRIAQPARTSNSFIDIPITEEHQGLLARQTLFVEQGPVVSFHASTFGFVFPFDLTSPMGWGIENIWSLRSSERGLRMGIIDAVPVDHSMRKPVVHYSWDEADRGRSELLAASPHRPTEECFKVVDVVQLEEWGP